MRILFVTHYFHPEVGAAPTRTLELANELSSRGHAVSVLTGFPNYMAAARPVVASGWTAEVIVSAEAGIACPPEQPAAPAEAIARVTADPGQARAMGLNGRRYVEAHLTVGWRSSGSRGR